MLMLNSLTPYLKVTMIYKLVSDAVSVEPDRAAHELGDNNYEDRIFM